MDITETSIHQEPSEVSSGNDVDQQNLEIDYIGKTEQHKQKTDNLIHRDCLENNINCQSLEYDKIFNNSENIDFTVKTLDNVIQGNSHEIYARQTLTLTNNHPLMSVRNVKESSESDGSPQKQLKYSDEAESYSDDILYATDNTLEAPIVSERFDGKTFTGTDTQQLGTDNGNNGSGMESTLDTSQYEANVTPLLQSVALSVSVLSTRPTTQDTHQMALFANNYKRIAKHAQDADESSNETLSNHSFGPDFDDEYDENNINLLSRSVSSLALDYCHNRAGEEEDKVDYDDDDDDDDDDNDDDDDEHLAEAERYQRDDRNDDNNEMAACKEMGSSSNRVVAEQYLVDEDELNAPNWQRITLANGKTRDIDMKVIEPYKRVLSHGGYLSSGGHNAIILFCACHLPDRSRTDYHYVMDNLFLYVVKTLEQLVTEDYVLVYLHGGCNRRNVPPFPWLKKCYQLLDRRLRKSLKNLFMVHPTFWIKSLVWMARPFISSKFWRKLIYIQTLDELYRLVPLERTAVPDKVKKFDVRQK